MKNTCKLISLIGLSALEVNISDLIIKLGQLPGEYFEVNNINEEYLLYRDLS